MVQRALQVHGHEGFGGQGQRGVEDTALGNLRNTKHHAGDGNGHNADDHGTGHAQRKQRTNQKDARHRKQHLGVAKVAKGHKGGGAGGHKTTALHADKGDKGANTDHDGVLEIHGYCIDDKLAHLGDGKQQKDHARNKHRAKAGLPRIPRRATDVVGEKGRNAEAGGHAHGESGPQAHDKCGDNRHPDGGRHGGILGHTSVSKHAGDHKNEVAHGHKAGKASPYLAPNRAASGRRIKHFFQYVHDILLVLPRYAFKLFGEQYRAGAADPMPLKHPITLPVQRGRLRPPRRAYPLTAKILFFISKRRNTQISPFISLAAAAC